MSQRKPPQPLKKAEVSLVRSSAAEYLIFVAATGNAQSSVEMRYEDENLWLTQKMMATLYDVSVPAVSQHLKRIYADSELEREATVKQYLMVQTEGEREVQRKVDHRLGVRSCIDASPLFRPESPDVPSASNRVCRRAAPGHGARQSRKARQKQGVGSCGAESGIP